MTIDPDPIAAQLREAICRNPEDDLARLAYADRLEEIGGDPERVAFIRRGIAWRNRQHQVEYCRGNAVDCVVREWPDSYASITRDVTSRRIRHCYPVWRRGFIEQVVTTLHLWHTHGRAFVWLHPITRVWLVHTEPNQPYRSGGRWFWPQIPSKLTLSGLIADRLARNPYASNYSATGHVSFIHRETMDEAVSEAMIAIARDRLAARRELLPEGEFANG